MFKQYSALINLICYGEPKAWLAAFTLPNADSILALSDNLEPVPRLGEAKAMTASCSSGGLEEVTDIQLASATLGQGPVL